MKAKQKTRALELKVLITVTLWAVPMDRENPSFQALSFLGMCDHIKQLLTRGKQMPLNQSLWKRMARGLTDRYVSIQNYSVTRPGGIGQALLLGNTLDNI